VVRDNTITDNADAGGYNGDAGVYLRSSSDNAVRANTITHNGDDGVYLRSSSDNAVANNTITDNDDGVVLFRSSDNNVVRDNTITHNDESGVVLSGSSGNVLQGNAFEGEGVVLGGNDVREFQHEIDASNTVNGDPIRYVEGEDGESVPAPAGQVIVANAQNVTVTGLSLSNTSEGLQVAFSENVTIQDNTITDNRFEGVYLSRSSDNVVEDNIITDNGYGMDLFESSDNVVRDNTITNNDWNGVALWSSSDNAVANNTITDNGYFGVYLSSSSDNAVRANTITHHVDGVILFGSSDNAVANNTITDNDDGVRLSGSSDDNVVEANVIQGNTVGIALEERWGDVPTGTIIHDNNIHDNTDAGLHAANLDAAVDATDNWWGHETGPSGGEEDCTTGDTADGQGDAIATSNAEVCFDPWRTSPNPDAGAGG
jgi:parallel beta-helix repeat protein